MEISGNIADENTDYGSGGQSPATSDPIEEDIPRLSSKTSLTQSDSHKVVIEVTDSDAETSKGVSSLQKYEPKFNYLYEIYMDIRILQTNLWSDNHRRRNTCLECYTPNHRLACCRNSPVGLWYALARVVFILTIWDCSIKSECSLPPRFCCHGT